MPYLEASSTVDSSDSVATSSLTTDSSLEFSSTVTFSSSSSLSGGENAATSSNIMTGYSAFIDGEKIEGSLDVKNYYVGTSEPSSSLGNDGDIYLKK